MLRMESVVAMALTSVLAATVCGCAQDAYAGPGPSYPEPIGYTLAPASPSAVGTAPDQGEPQAGATVAGPSGEVVIGDDGYAQAPSAAVAPQDPSSLAQGVAPEGAPPQSGGEYADYDPSALTEFQGVLSPYGNWVDDPTYGRVWVPSPGAVGSDFTPYVTAGHWAYDDDYTWVSDYDWGWAPFHYGRWVWVSGMGWEWIPGRVYSGAWVSWRYGWGDWGYVGWAPLGPTWCWRNGRAVGLGFVPRAPYAFVGAGELFSPHLGGRVIAGAQAGAIAGHTQPYVPANPVVAGRALARPSVAGPPPSMLNIAPGAVVRGASADRGVMMARSYAAPRAVMARGTNARVVASPAGWYAGARVSAGYGTGRATPAYAPSRSALGSASVPAYAPAASHFGGRLGGGFAGGGVSSAPGWGRPAVSEAASAPRPYFAGAPASAPAVTGPVRGTYSASTPAVRNVTGYRAPAFNAGSAHGSSPVFGGGGFHGGGSFHSSGGGFHGGSSGGSHGGHR